MRRRRFRHARRFNRHVRRRVRRNVRRGLRRGRGLVGLAGLAAVGYLLLDKHQREQNRSAQDPYMTYEDQPPEDTPDSW